MASLMDDLPAGVRLQNAGNIRILWWYKGKHFSETLNLPHTKEGISKAVEVRISRIEASKSGADWRDVVLLPAGGASDLASAYSKMFSAARKRSKAYSLTAKQERHLKQRAGGKCELTGIRFDTNKRGATKAPFAPSLDRIDSSKGYEVGNVRLVCVAANFAMNEWGESVLLELAKGYLAQQALENGQQTDKKEAAE